MDNDTSTSEVFFPNSSNLFPFRKDSLPITSDNFRLTSTLEKPKSDFSIFITYVINICRNIFPIAGSPYPIFGKERKQIVLNLGNEVPQTYTLSPHNPKDRLVKALDTLKRTLAGYLNPLSKAIWGSNMPGIEKFRKGGEEKGGGLGISNIVNNIVGNIVNGISNVVNDIINRYPKIGLVSLSVCRIPSESISLFFFLDESFRSLAFDLHSTVGFLRFTLKKLFRGRSGSFGSLESYSGFKFLDYFLGEV